jgi:hypothetical protein
MLFGKCRRGSTAVSLTSIGTHGVVVALLAACLLTLISGVGGFFPQSLDYAKHNQLFIDLVKRPWPVVYNNNFFLCYSIGYYLPIALIAKLLGSHFINLISFVWCWLGLFLFYSWLMALARKRLILFIIAFSFFSGLGFLWHAFRNDFFMGLTGLTIDGHPLAVAIHEQAGLYNRFFDLYTRVNYPTQHAIAGLLLTCFILHRLLMVKTLEGCYGMACLSLLWSPFTAIGAFPLFFAGWLLFRRLHLGLNEFVLCLAIVTAIGPYYLMHLPLHEKSFIWQNFVSYAWMILYIVFILVNLVIPSVFIWWLSTKCYKLGDLKLVFYCCVIFLALIPLVKVGRFGDFHLQASCSGMVVLAFCAAYLITNMRLAQHPYAYLAFLFYLILGSTAPISKIAVTMRSAREYDLFIIQSKNYSGINELNMFEGSSHQYLGSRKNYLYSVFMRPND